MTAEERRILALETDVDVRLTDLSALVMTCTEGVLGAVLEDDHARAVLFGFLRSAYATGYQHALQEVVDGRGGELNRLHGYEIPS